MCFISLNEEKCRLFFDVLFVRLPYSDSELSRFFKYGGGPLVSILNASPSSFRYVNIFTC